ncbi:MAG: hypothetical protein KGI27_09260 [Thaumarchaeota archaeon]|nr:hypothetical protein [Nitrososphaerota archaeon]
MESTSSQAISKETLSNLKDWRADCKYMKNAFLAESSRETDQLTKTLYKSLAASFVNAELISSWIELSFAAINDLGKTVDNIHDKREPRSPKKELSHARHARTRPVQKTSKK